MTDRNYPYALPVGTDISGYVIESVLGAGGFGVTYRARNPVTGVTVAIKEFFPQGLATRQGAAVHLHADVSEGSYETALRKFEQEAAKLTGRYRHPNIVRGVNFLRANNTAYFVMEFIAGISLDIYLNSKTQPADETELRHIFEPIFDAVDYIHSLDGMHRDLTPRNIMIRPDGTAMLVDFGAAGEGLDTERPYSTAFAQPNYAPPEQLAYDDGRMQGRHTDIFSLAGVLYRAVAGQPPARPLKRSQEVSIHGSAADPYVPLADAAIAPQFYHPQFFLGIDRALRLDYRERPASILEFRQDLGWEAPTAVYHPSDIYDDVDEPTVAVTDRSTTAMPRIAAGDHIPVTGFGEPPRRSLMSRVLIGAALVLGLTIAGAATWTALAPDANETAMKQIRRDAQPQKPADKAPAQQPEKPAQAQTPPADAPPAQPQPPAQPPAPVTPPPAPLPPAKPPVPPPADQGWLEFPGLMPTGSIVQSVAGVAAPTIAQCAQACKDDRTCQAYAIEKQSCQLFTNVTGVLPDSNARAAARPNGAAAGLIKSSLDRSEARKAAFRRLEGVSLAAPVGASLNVMKGVESEQVCAFACSSNAQCKGYDFQAEQKSCRLMREVHADNASALAGHVAAVEDGDGQLTEALKRAAAPKPRAAQTFADVDIGGEVIAREASANSDACQKTCLADQSCIASVYSDQFCTRFSQVNDMDLRPGSTVHVDTRQGALILRLQALATPKAPIGQEPTQLGPQPAPPMDVTQPQMPQQPGQAQVPPPIQPPAQPGSGPDGPPEPFEGYEVVGGQIVNDAQRGARFEEACELACQDTASCVAYTFGRAENRCRLYGNVQDIAPSNSSISGIYQEAGPQAVEQARRKISMKEVNRANFKPMPAGCAPTGQATMTSLGQQGSAEQCEFLCQSAQNCQAWVFSNRDRTCHQLSQVLGAIGGVDAVSGVLDPSGKRIRELAKVCGPIPPAPIGNGQPAPQGNGGGFFRVPF